jgi:hypothetical protein
MAATLSPWDCWTPERALSALATLACLASRLASLTVAAGLGAGAGLTCDAAAARACIAILSLIDMLILHSLLSS